MSLRKRLTKLAAKDPLQFPKNWRVPGGASQIAERRRKELDLWRQWKETNEDPKHLQPLMTSLQPTITYSVNRFAPANVYRPALRAKANNLTIGALRRYDPTKGTLLNSHVTNHLKGLNRWTGTHQNVSRITEDRRNMIGKYDTAYNSLKEQYGYEPSTKQIAEEMGVNVKSVRMLEKERRPDLVASAFQDDPFVDESALDKEIMDLIEFALDPDELRMWEYLYGVRGKQKVTKGGDLARKLGWSQSKVSQVRKRIAKKVNYYTAGLS